MTKTTKTLTTEQIEALRAYAARYGRTWKSRLNADWMRACYPNIDEVYWAPLQQVRNTFGPSWLVSFKLEGR